MTHESPNTIHAAPSAPAPHPALLSRSLSTTTVALLFSAELLLTFLVELPTVADFTKFAFYDQGASLRLNQLFAAGRKPTIDLGYSYGMLPLVIGRAWFAILGRTSAAYIAFVTLCNLVGAWAVARFLAAIQPGWHGLMYPSTRASADHGIPLPVVAVACLLLPFAITPANYSFMHPLEMVLFLLALAQQARGRYGSALAFATAALLTKPSMAFVLGFLLLAFAYHRRVRPTFLLPSIAVLAGGVILFWFAVNPHAAVANLVPLTGGHSYRLMNFGFFHAGRNFWLHPYFSLSDSLQYYFLKPVLFWFAATFCLFGLAIPAIARLFRKSAAQPSDPLLITIALLHAAFIFFFYAWDRSWTYYSYLPVLGVLVGLPSLTRKKFVLLPLLALVLLAHCDHLSYGYDSWKWWRRSPETANLWTDDQFHDEWLAVHNIAREAGSEKTLFLTNGALSMLFPEIKTPETWFLSPGIPTEFEISRVKNQIDHADRVVLYLDYDQTQEAWNWPEFATQSAQFDQKPPLWQGNHFRVLQRNPPP